MPNENLTHEIKEKGKLQFLMIEKGDIAIEPTDLLKIKNILEIESDECPHNEITVWMSQVVKQYWVRDENGEWEVKESKVKEHRGSTAEIECAICGASLSPSDIGY